MSQLKSTTCSLPWNQASILPDGNIRVCCFNDLSRYYSSETKENFSKPLPPQSTILNSDLHFELRQDFLNNKRPNACQYCFKKEDLQQTSRRQQVTDPDFDPPLTPQLEHLDLRVSSICNLHCIMCSADYSTSWQNLLGDEWPQSRPTRPLQNSDSLLTSILNDSSQLQSLKSIQLAGGEPFLYKPYQRFIKKLSTLIDLKKIKIKINSNMTFIDADWLQLLNSFEEVHILLSLDAPGTLNNLYRPPSQIQKIISHYQLMRESWSHSKFSSVTTIHSFNLFHLDETLAFISRQFPEVSQMGINPVFFPEYLNVRFLPDPLKRIAELQLMNIEKLSFLEKIDPSGLSLLKNLIQDNHSYSYQKTEKLLQFSKAFFSSVSDESKSLLESHPVHTFFKTQENPNVTVDFIV